MQASNATSSFFILTSAKDDYISKDQLCGTSGAACEWDSWAMDSVGFGEMLDRHSREVANHITRVLRKENQ